MPPVRRRRWVLLLLCAALTACAPARPVRNHPVYIRAAVAPGDSVRIETREGRVLRLRVADVRGGEILGEGGERVALGDIDALALRTWGPVPQPCGDGRPLGCSVPAAVSAASVYHDHYRVRFEQACIQHDFCYRHGHATYGYDRKHCDDRFITDMEDECESGRFGSDWLVGSIDRLSRGAACHSAAWQFYDAVRLFGEKAFHKTDSTVCEYE